MLILLFFALSSISASYGNKDALYAYRSSVLRGERLTVIIDAGHGGEDPGAIDNGVKEKDLNLTVAKKLGAFLTLSDVDVVYTRTTDTLLYGAGQEKSKKQYDLKNRVAIAEKYDNAVLISIHMNKFTVKSCKGLQTFYCKKSEESKALAEYVQTASKLLQPFNDRAIKDENGTIYLLENTSKPAVLIECGFISNEEEAKLLQNDEYQNKLAFSIFSGISNWISSRGN